MMIPANVTPTVAFPANAANPQGFINYGNLALLAASHPQNPYGVATRLRYSAFDVGASTRSANNEFKRAVIGIKGSAAGWDYDAGYTHSESSLDLGYSNMINMNVLRSALSDPTSRYFPYYIGDQAYRNPASLYAALRVNATSVSTTKLDIVDFKASRELFELPGGKMGLALGGEYRSKMDNTAYAGALCANTLVSGAKAPNAKCETASFTTLDLSTRYNISKQLTLFASMNNVLDKMAPLDPQTYGGMSYNPMDASGAIGRYMKLGASYKFF